MVSDHAVICEKRGARQICRAPRFVVVVVESEL